MVMFTFSLLQTKSSQNDEWSWGTDNWNSIDQPTTNKKNIQKFNSTQNSDLTSNNYSVPDLNNRSSQSLVNSNRPTYNVNNGIENGQHIFPTISNNWIDKTERHLEQITNLQHTYTNQDIDNKKSENIIETDDIFCVVENREILPPESFQNDSHQVAMNNLQISDEVSYKLIFI